MTAYGSGVAEAILEFDEVKQPFIKLTIDTVIANDRSTTIPISLEVSEKGRLLGTTPVSLRMISRAIFIPTTVYFQPVGNQYQAEVKVSCIPLASQSSENKPLVARLLFADKKTERSAAATIVPQPPASLSLITLKIDAKEMVGRTPTSVRLSCGTWEGSVDCKLVK